MLKRREMAMYSRSLLLAMLALPGCAPRNLPPEQAQVVLSNARVERINGEDKFLVDFQFTRGRPDRNKTYRFVLISGSNEKYLIDKLWTEKTLSGTIEAEMSFRFATFEPSKYFEGHLEIMTAYDQGKPISNTITFGTPTAQDVVGGDGEPDPPPRSEQPQIAQAPPAAVPDIPTPPAGIGRFPRGNVPQAGVPLGGLESIPGPVAGTPPSTAASTAAPQPPASTVPTVSGKDTPLAGGKGGAPFRTGDASGRIVIGFRYAVGSWAGQPALRTFEPLYERAKSAREGEVVARDGYAVGGLNVDAMQYVHAVQIVFMRMSEGDRLDPADSYTSDWLGTRTDAAITSLDGSSAPVVGIHGRKAAILDAVGLVHKQ